MAVNPMELRDTVLRITGVNPRKCMKCGKCSGTCPAYDQMEYHPHQFVAPPGDDPPEGRQPHDHE